MQPPASPCPCALLYRHIKGGKSSKTLSTSLSTKTRWKEEGKTFLDWSVKKPPKLGKKELLLPAEGAVSAARELPASTGSKPGLTRATPVQPQPRGLEKVGKPWEAGRSQQITPGISPNAISLPTELLSPCGGVLGGPAGWESENTGNKSPEQEGGFPSNPIGWIYLGDLSRQRRCLSKGHPDTAGSNSQLFMALLRVLVSCSCLFHPARPQGGHTSALCSCQSPGRSHQCPPSAPLHSSNAELEAALSTHHPGTATHCVSPTAPCQ